MPGSIRRSGGEPTLDPVIHQATRLRIMTALHRNREARFTSLRDGLGLTDGNLGSHAGKLEEAGYIASRNALTPSGFEVRYRITSEGSRAFRAYVDALRALLAAPDLGDTTRPFNDRTTPVNRDSGLDKTPEV